MERKNFLLLMYIEQMVSLQPLLIKWNSRVTLIPLLSLCFSFYCCPSTELGSPRDLETRDVTDTSFYATWVPAPGNVRQYRVTWKSLYSDEAGEKTIRGDTTATVLDGLTPETRYRVTVYATYGRGEGQPLVGEETTDSKFLGFYFDIIIVKVA